MGYYASTEFAFTFKDAEAIKVAAFGYDPETTDATELLDNLIREVGEEADWSFLDDGLTIAGWTGGKYYDDAMGTFVDTLAGFATGHLDGHGEDDSFWRVRLFKDGSVRTFDGTIVYADDPGEEE